MFDKKVERHEFEYLKEKYDGLYTQLWRLEATMDRLLAFLEVEEVGQPNRVIRKKNETV